MPAGGVVSLAAALSILCIVLTLAWMPSEKVESYFMTDLLAVFGGRKQVVCDGFDQHRSEADFAVVDALALEQDLPSLVIA